MMVRAAFKLVAMKSLIFRSFLVSAVAFISLPLCCQESRPQKVDLVVTHGLVVTMNGTRAIYDDGAVAIKGDTIVAVGPESEIEAKYVASQTIDAKGKLVLPGFINGHTHVPMTLFRGLHDDVTLDDWLHKYIFPAEAKNVTEDFVRWGTRLAAAEQIRSGVTTFADMYYFEDAVAEETESNRATATIPAAAPAEPSDGPFVSGDSGATATFSFLPSFMTVT